MACDDNCSFKISLTDPLDPAAAEQLMYNDAWTTYRNSDIPDKSETNEWFEKRFSRKVTLVKDEYYYVESTLYNGSGASNLDVGMEIAPSPMPASHPNLESQVQKMSIG